MKLKTLILVAAIQFLSNIASAEMRATCWQNDCFKFGWSVTGIQITDAVENKCREENCSEIGWYSARFGGESTYTQCMNDQCFKEGYWVIENYTQKVLETVRCRGPKNETDCHKYGWQSFKDNRSYHVDCRNNDCLKNGWDIFDFYADYQSATCINSDCAKNGWVYTGGNY